MGKILVVEDSLIVNQHIKKTLQSGNHEVISAYSGKEAVKTASQERPDLILMDIMMETQSDGIDAAFEIKNSIDIPIIFLTALTDKPTIQKAKLNLPYGYVVKPFNETELLSNIDVALYKANVERKIKENGELFQAIIHSIDKAIFLLNADGNIKYTNSIGEEITKKPFATLIHQPIRGFLKFRNRNRSPVIDIWAEENQLDREVYLNGSEVVYGDFHSQRILLDEPYILFHFKDITERVRIRETKENIKNKRLSSFIEGQEKERERIARDLHDGVAQIANMIGLSVKNGDTGENLTKMIHQFLDEIRKVTEGLTPSRLIDFPIDVCIKKIVGQANEHAKIKFEFYSEDVPELNIKYKTNLYRIVQENLSNIIKHSKAHNATIQLHGFEHHLQMTIEDDGVGFIVDEYGDDHAHHGVQNMLFRSEAMNAECEIHSDKKGTFINLIIPLNGQD